MKDGRADLPATGGAEPLKGKAMQAIVTKWLPPTDTRGSRIKAKCQAGSLTVSWDHALDVQANHEAAAKALIAKLGWDQDCYPRWHAGALPDDTGYAIVFESKKGG